LESVFLIDTSMFVSYAWRLLMESGRAPAAQSNAAVSTAGSSCVLLLLYERSAEGVYRRVA
jgi:hypothetical protein